MASGAERSGGEDAGSAWRFAHEIEFQGGEPLSSNAASNPNTPSAAAITSGSNPRPGCRATRAELALSQAMPTAIATSASPATRLRVRGRDS